MGGPDLALAAIDEQQVGQPALALHQPGVAPGQRLLHGGVIVARLDVLDVETAIIGFYRAFHPEHNARGDRGFPLGMTDIEAFHAFGQFIQRQRLLQFMQPPQIALARIRNAASASSALLSASLSQRARSLRTPVVELNPVSGLLAQHRLDQILILRLVAEQQFRRNAPAQVILGDKSRQDLFVA